MDNPTLEKLKELAACFGNEFDTTCILCQSNLQKIEAAYTLGLSQGQDAERMKWEELEASVCPEDVGFVEYIGVLKKAVKNGD